MDQSVRTCRRSMVAVFVTILLQGVGAFEVNVQKSECIHQLVDRDGDMVTGNFVVVNQDAESYSERDDVEIQVIAPSGDGIIKMKARGGQKFEFPAPRAGYYKLCFVNLNPSAPKKVDFAIRVGQSLHPKDLAQNENFSPLEFTIVQLREALDKVSLEQKFLKARDLRHRRTNESTSSRLLWYTALEYISLIGISLAQVFLIRSLFSKRIGYNSV